MRRSNVRLTQIRRELLYEEYGNLEFRLSEAAKFLGIPISTLSNWFREEIAKEDTWFERKGQGIYRIMV